MAIKVGLYVTLLLGYFWEATACNAPVPSIPDLGRRGSSYKVSGSEPYLKDSTLRIGWYSANDGNRHYSIVNGTVPKLVHCGTFFPVYVREEITAELDNGKEYNYTACLVHYDNNCTLQYDIKIRSCNGEIQYYLVSTDAESAYCFEPSSVVVPAPNYSIPGDIVVSVALMYIQLGTFEVPQLDFQCNFNASDAYYYDISWAINGRVEKTFPATTFEKINATNLKEAEILQLGFSLGFSVRCLVRISSDSTGNRTAPQLSDVFFAGIKTSTQRLILPSTEKETNSIQIWATIPFGCERSITTNGTEPCDFRIQMFNPNYNDYTCETTVLTVKYQTACGIVLNGMRKSQGGPCLGIHDASQCTYKRFSRGLQKEQFTITTANEQLVEKTFTLQLKAGPLVYHNILKNVKVDDIQVIYSGSITYGRQCAVQNDPYVIKFNNDRFYFDDTGYFIMYNNTKLHNDVQIKSHPCYVSGDKSVTCACAVSVQAGGDVFMVDVCSIVPRVSFLHCRGNVLNVREVNSKYYEIYLPSGTQVNVEMSTSGNSSLFLKVYIKPSPSDINSTEGICGDPNDKCVPYEPNYGKIRQKDASAWRIIQSALNTPDYSLHRSFFPPKTVCTCPTGNQTSFCSQDQYATCINPTKLPGQRKHCTIRNKRSIRRHKRNIERLIKMSTLTDLDTTRVKRSTNLVFTEEEAYEQCLNHFASKQLFGVKEKLPEVPDNSTLSGCINDVMRDGRNELWKQENFLAWTMTVMMAIRRNKTYQEENIDVVQMIQNITCPFECHGNGDCKNGTCVCWEDFVGDSCFVRWSYVLEMTDVEGGGFCDLKHGDDCHECLQFHTTNLLEGFKCKINAYEVDVTGSVIKEEEDIRTGEYENIFEGYCCPSSVSRRKKRSLQTESFVIKYSISISNDGVHYGENKDVYVYDSTCQEYLTTDNGTIFTLKENTCFINGECFRNGESLVNEAMSTCCPSLNSYQWTPKEECSGGSNTDSGKDMMTIIAAVCGSVGGVLAVAICLCLVSWKLKANKRDIRVSTPDLNSEASPYYVNTAFDDAVFEAKPQKESSNGNKHFSAKRSFFEMERPPVYSNLN